LENHARTRKGKRPTSQKATIAIEKLAYPRLTFKLINKIIIKKFKKEKEDNLKTHHPRQSHPTK
jgi:hypothetical protein